MGIKQPPQAVEVEQAVLGAILIDPEGFSRIADKLRSGDFYLPKHRQIFHAAASLFLNDNPIDIATMTDELNRNGGVDRIGGRTYLVDLVSCVATAANIQYHADIIREKASRRQMLKRASEIAQECYDDSIETVEIIDRTEQALFRITQQTSERDFRHIGDFIPEVINTFEDTFRHPDRRIGLQTGFIELDDMIGGLERGDLIIIAGRPSSGKTTLAMNIAEHVALEGCAVGVCSLETTGRKIVARMLCSRSRVNLYLAKKGKIKESDFGPLTEAAGKLHDSVIYIDDTSGVTPMAVRAKARRLKIQTGLDLLIIDYLQLMGSSRRAENRQQEITAICASLKGLAQELDIPIMVLSQLSRAPESRRDGRPRLTDLRESGSIEQDAALVMLIHRPEQFKVGDRPGQAEIIVAKQKDGPIGKVDLALLKWCVRFENMANVGGKTEWYNK